MLPLQNTLSTVVCICYTNISTNYTSIFIAPVVAFVADVNQCVWIHKGIAYDAFAIAWKMQTKRKIFIRIVAQISSSFKREKLLEIVNSTANRLVTYISRRVFQSRHQAASCTSQGPDDASPSFSCYVYCFESLTPWFLSCFSGKRIYTVVGFASNLYEDKQVGIMAWLIFNFGQKRHKKHGLDCPSPVSPRISWRIQEDQSCETISVPFWKTVAGLARLYGDGGNGTLSQYFVIDMKQMLLPWNTGTLRKSHFEKLMRCIEIQRGMISLILQTL